LYQSVKGLIIRVSKCLSILTLGFKKVSMVHLSNFKRGNVMIYSAEVERMCPVAKGAYHGPAPVPEEGKLQVAEGAIGIALNANKSRTKPLRVILNGLGKDAEMMSFPGMGNNPMVGATVAVAVEQGLKK
jgi:hypothetical protein